MNKKTKKIVDFLDGIEWLFQINNFDMTLHMAKEDVEKNGHMSHASIMFNDDYQEIDVYIYPIFFTEDVESQRKILLHELCHSITNPMYDTFNGFIDGDSAVTKETTRQLVEKSTSQIENILDGLLQGGMKYAKEAYDDYLK